MYRPALPNRNTTIPRIRIHMSYTSLCLLPVGNGANLLRDTLSKFVDQLGNILPMQLRLSAYKYECRIKAFKRLNSKGHEEHKRIL